MFFTRLWLKCFIFCAKIAFLVIPIIFVFCMIKGNLGRIKVFWARHHQNIVLGVCLPVGIFSTRTTLIGLYQIIAFLSGHLDDGSETPKRHLWLVRSCALPASIYLWLWLRYWSLTNRERCNELVYWALPKKLARLRSKVKTEEQQNRRAVERISKTVAAQLAITAQQAQMQSLELDECDTVDCTQLRGSLVRLVNHLSRLEDVFAKSLNAVQKVGEEASTFSHSLVNEAHRAKLRLCLQEELEAKERAANLPIVKAKALKVMPLFHARQDCYSQRIIVHTKIQCIPNDRLLAAWSH
jgi:hypothetical protein